MVLAAKTAGFDGGFRGNIWRCCTRFNGNRHTRIDQIDLAGRVDVACSDEFVDRIRRQNDHVKRLARLHALGRIDAAYGFDCDICVGLTFYSRPPIPPVIDGSPLRKCL